MSRDNNKSAAPIYAVAALWVFWMIFFPLYSVGHYILLVLSSLILYNIVTNAGLKKVRRNQQPEKQQAEPEKNAPTGNDQVDKLIKDRDLAVKEMRRLDDNIKDEKISRQINDLEATTQKIFDYVIVHPDKIGQISKFLNYYLPTTLKLLNTYDRMGARGVEGENITGTMQKVEDTLEMVVSAFHKQLDTLFAGEAIDVSADITVMENLMKNEGLTDDGLGRYNITQE